MFYSDIKFPDILDGKDLFITLFISGTGKRFTGETLTDIVIKLQEDYISGLVISGDEVLHLFNRQSLCELTRTIKAIFGDSKKLLLRTNYSVDDIISWNDKYTDELLSYVEVIN